MSRPPTYFGPAASRPVIRGLGGDRVQVLTDGLATLDAAGLSEDHAIAIDPALADQVEVLRGPSTLLYGSGAAGGLVNVVTNRLHEQGDDGIHGLVELRGDTALGERAVTARVDGGTEQFMLHVDGVWRDTDDFEVPDEAGGEVPNSWSETRSGGAGASWIGDTVMLGVALSRYDTEYGVPNEDVLIDLQQDRLDVSARFDLPARREMTLRLRGAANDYEHAEVEPGGEFGTMFEVDGRELRATLDASLPADVEAAVGLQWQQVELVAIGEEAFVPESRTRATGAFGFARRAAGDGSLEFGLRIDRQEIDTLVLPDYDGHAVNGSFGFTWPVSGELAVVGQIVRSERHPSATELYADGPHVATQQFEIGNPGFDTERGWTADLGLRHAGDVVSGEIRAFASRYDGYLFLAPNGEIEDELPVFQYLQDDAEFYGFEAELALPIGAATTVTLLSDYVRGKLRAGPDLPRMPPFRLGAELAWQGPTLSLTLAARHVFEQDEIAELETETGSHTLLDEVARAHVAAQGHGPAGRSFVRRGIADRVRPRRRLGSVSMNPRRTLYPPIEPHRHGLFAVGDGHEIYWEECGNPSGKPVVFVHGGPGAGCDTRARRFFDPARYRILLFDQRGCGRSRPHASLEHNTTWDLVADMERLRDMLRVERWQAFGGSWGSTLALAYAETHPERVTELVLRGIFMLRPSELDWFYQEGASRIYPDRWEDYVAPIPPAERGDLMRAFHRRLTGDDRAAALAAARAWAIWEGSTSFLLTDDDNVRKWGEDEFALAVARIECHYFVNRGFLKRESQLLDDIGRIRHIPGVIVQGRHDIVCPMFTAWDLHRAWPEAEFRVVGDAGHSALEPGITDELVQATDRFSTPGR